MRTILCVPVARGTIGSLYDPTTPVQSSSHPRPSRETHRAHGSTISRTPSQYSAAGCLICHYRQRYPKLSCSRAYRKPFNLVTHAEYAGKPPKTDTVVSFDDTNGSTGCLCKSAPGSRTKNMRKDRMILSHIVQTPCSLFFVYIPASSPFLDHLRYSSHFIPILSFPLGVDPFENALS